MTVIIRQVDVTREELETEVEELRALVGKLNSGSELQNLMRTNNEMRAGLIEQCALIADAENVRLYERGFKQAKSRTGKDKARAGAETALNIAAKIRKLIDRPSWMTDEKMKKLEQLMERADELKARSERE